MKTLVALALVGTILNIVSCGPTLEQVINRIVPQILEDGVNKGVLSVGAYYLHTIKASSTTQKLHTLNLHIRGLNNQTRLDLKTTVDDDFNIKTWYYNYSIIKNTRSLGEGLGFAWLNYAASPKSEFCSNLGSYEEAEQLINSYGRPARRRLPTDNLKLKSSLKDVYDFGLEQYGDFLLPAINGWYPYEQSGVGIGLESDYYVLAYNFLQRSEGYRERNLDIYNVYQPCSGTIYSYADKFDSSGR